ncbi:MAG: extracellular solute-binding protein [Anaerolineae bacterium]
MFHAAMLRSFQWDGGLWGLPVGGTPQVLIYDRSAFDAAALTYPDATWTFEQFENAVRALTQLDSSGIVTRPGFAASGAPALMLRALLGRGVYSDPPLFTDPALIDLLTRWSELYRVNYITHESVPAPLRLGTINDLASSAPEQNTLAAALLPGKQAGLTVGGLAVSAGSANPELAFELAKYLSIHEQAASRMFYAIPPTGIRRLLKTRMSAVQD